MATKIKKATKKATTKKGIKAAKKPKAAKVNVQETEKGVYAISETPATDAPEIKQPEIEAVEMTIEDADKNNQQAAEQERNITPNEIIQENASYNNAFVPRTNNDSVFLYIAAALALMLLAWMFVL